MLARRLLWNRPQGGRARQQPVVVLLGPAGAGKTTALKSISDDCGGDVVHALFDFRRPEPVTTVEVLARIAFDLSRRWTARRPARFHRFTLGLIAVLTPLDTLTRDQAKRTLQEAIDRAFPGPRHGIDGWVDALADTAVRSNVLTPVLGETIKTVLPPLFRAIARRPLQRGRNWHTDVFQADGATSALDALVMLNQLARVRQEEMTAWLTTAFLADVRENHLRMSAPDLSSSCSCDNPDQVRHLHNWLILLDNLDQHGGHQFIADLLTAREHHLLRHPGDHDPLVVIASSGRWNLEWERDWLPPWKSPDGRAAGVRMVPRCRNADYRHWSEGTDFDRPTSPYYPVLLEPLDIDETARILGTSRFTGECVLVQRATGGLPRAVHDAAPPCGGRLRPGGRNTLWPSGLDGWRTRLHDLRLTTHLPDVDDDEFVAAAPFATAPWLVPAESTSLVAQPQVGRILTELRTALWVIAPGRGGGTLDHAEVHPWVARTLLTALADHPVLGDVPCYETQFAALLSDPATRADPVRTAYCRLALGRIADVVDHFETTFQELPHQNWVDRLVLVTSAPDHLTPGRDSVDLYHDLVTEDVRATGADRSPLRNVLARLIAANWLVSNPFATPEPRLRDIVANSFDELLRLSHRPDVAALTAAADRARKLF